MKWTRRNLDKKNNKIYFSDQNPTFHRPPEFSFELIDDDLSKAAFDFALLTSCNHTIISRGMCVKNTLKAVQKDYNAAGMICKKSLFM